MLKFFLFILLFICILIFLHTYYENWKIKKNLKTLTEELNNFLLYPSPTDFSLEEGPFYNLLLEVRALEKQFLQEKEIQAQREREMAHFIENMAHQMKTSVTALQIRLDLAENCFPPELENHDIQKAQKYIEQLSNEIDMILKSSQLAEEKISMKMETLDLYELICICIEHLTVFAEKKNVTFQIEGLSSLSLSGDYFWLSQAIENLLKNAVEHTKEGSPISLILKEENGSAHLYIRDYGNGLPPQELSKIFRRFYRGGFSKTGYGIGLSMAWDIIHAHHGTLTAGNCEDEGAWFSLSLPLLSDSRIYSEKKIFVDNFPSSIS